MDVELTRDAQKAAAKLYKAYLDKVHNGSSKTSAREFSDEEIAELFVYEYPEDVMQLRETLKNTFTVKVNIWGDITLSDSFIAYMENRYKNGIKDILSFLAQFIP